MDYILPKILYWQFLVTPQLPKTTFEGQTIIVTGGNAGLGLEAVRHFVQMNAKKVIIACRSPSKGEKAKDDIEASTGRTGVIEILQADLESYESIKAFAKEVEKLDRLDAIVENAGISTKDYKLAEGEESTITVNVISTFLMALLVLPKLQESAEKYGITPRLVIMASDVHFMTDLNKDLKQPSIFDSLRDEKTAPMGFQRYAQSKLMEVLYCRTLAEKMNKNGKPFVILDYANPGLCHSGLGGESYQNRLAMFMKNIFARSTVVGARTEVAAAAFGKEAHGKFINNGVIAEPSVFARSQAGAVAGQRIYDELHAKLETISPGITQNI